MSPGEIGGGVGEDRDGTMKASLLTIRRLRAAFGRGSRPPSSVLPVGSATALRPDDPRRGGRGSRRGRRGGRLVLEDTSPMPRETGFAELGIVRA